MENLQLTVDGKEIHSLTPYLNREAMYVIWVVAHNLGAEVQWDSEKQHLKITCSDLTLRQWLKGKILREVSGEIPPNFTPPPPEALTKPANNANDPDESVRAEVQTSSGYQLGEGAMPVQKERSEEQKENNKPDKQNVNEDNEDVKSSSEDIRSKPEEETLEEMNLQNSGEEEIPEEKSEKNKRVERMTQKDNTATVYHRPYRGDKRRKKGGSINNNSDRANSFLKHYSPCCGPGGCKVEK